MTSLRSIRLFVDVDLIEGKSFELLPEKSHYICNVMRCKTGDIIKCFNAKSGEFLCHIDQIDKKHSILTPQKQIREAEAEEGIWLLFAPLKKDKTDFVIEKAVELGVGRIIPIITRYTNSEKIKTDRFVAQAIEASEQCERLSVPDISTPQKLEQLIKQWDTNRILFFMDERRKGIAAIKAFQEASNKSIAILIGPEGGFSDEEAKLLDAQSFVKNVNLGPRILRAETAALASLAVYQACDGDWKK